MPLYIRDNEVDRLATELQLLTRVSTKTEAVRQALRREIARARAAIPLRDRLARAKGLVRAIGPTDPQFDAKPDGGDEGER